MNILVDFECGCQVSKSKTSIKEHKFSNPYKSKNYLIKKHKATAISFLAQFFLLGSFHWIRSDNKNLLPAYPIRLIPPRLNRKKLQQWKNEDGEPGWKLMILSQPAVFQLELWQWPFIQFARFIQIVRRGM